MIRKTLVAVATAAALATVALPSAASAKNWKNHHNHGYRTLGVIGLGVGIATAGYYASNCYGYEWRETRRGWRQVLVNYCD
jgi:hypothetical protein